jgi:Putative transposase
VFGHVGLLLWGHVGLVFFVHFWRRYRRHPAASTRLRSQTARGQPGHHEHRGQDEPCKGIGPHRRREAYQYRRGGWWRPAHAAAAGSFALRGMTADVDAFVMGRLCAQVEGYNLQAATRISANDRDGLERMGRYLARAPIATDRLSQLDDGRLELRPKRPWRDGTTAFVYTPHELIERLVAQMPRPRAHLTRYHGVLAPAFAARSQIVPGLARSGPYWAGRPDREPFANASPVMTWPVHSF